VPVWHARTRELVKAGKLQTLGIVQEQHPERAALFMQWQQMEWPVLADPFNLLGVKVVPITYLVDGSGIIRFKNPSENDLKKFLATRYPRTVVQEVDHRFDDSFEGRRKEVLQSPGNPIANFRFGVAMRRRFDSPKGNPKDFLMAVQAWERALKLQPDQYIWRRRIQQYGPRLDKPYSFYDWVNQARAEIKKRGEEPLVLRVEPKGSEFAYPEKAGKGLGVAPKHPDPEGKVPEDTEGMVGISVVVVPSTKGDGGAARVHLGFTPSPDKLVHWTNDAGSVSYHLEEGSGVSIHDLNGPGPVPDIPASNEKRAIEFEIRPKGGGKLPGKLKGAVYYYVCEGAEGVCRYLRQPVTITIRK
jgi:hypothetical protein